jgi:hypothetical protein
MVMCIGCLVPDAGLNVSLLHVTWFVSLANPNKQWLTDTRQATACNARLKIVGLVIRSHVGDTGSYVYVDSGSRARLSNLASSIYIF